MVAPLKATLWILASVLVLSNIEYSNAAQLCANPAPGVAKMVRGVDITTLDLLPLDGFPSQGVKFPIVSLTCNNGGLWTNPHGDVYERPDQVWSLTTIPRGFASAQAMVFRGALGYRDWFNIQAGFEGEYANISFSASASYIRMQQATLAFGKQIEDVMSFESTSRADLIPFWQLRMDPFAQMFIDDYLLTPYNETTRHMYEKFIKMFGTHYFASANFGGIIRLYMETDMYYGRYKSIEELKVEAKAAFQGEVDLGEGESKLRISGKGKLRVGKQLASELFYRATSFDVKYYGGNANILSFKGVQKWHKSVDLDPWLFYGKLFPITNLIHNQSKKKNMIKAVRQHIWRSYLKELFRIIVAAKLKIHHRIIDRLQRAIEEQQKLPFVPIKKAMRLGEAVNYHLVVPPWFTYETYLCFKWHASSDAGKQQCNNGTGGHHSCAKPNGQTKRYLDNTADLIGGCNMQWGIHSTNHPHWFKNASICYRWQATGDASQCGDGENSKTVCSPVNSFTPEYLDNTDSRNGGCQLSWKLHVENDAPVWLQTSTICFEWSSTGDSGQCMYADHPMSKCVTANDWTPYYLDQTDERDGGCHMSWGWYLPLQYDKPSNKLKH